MDEFVMFSSSTKNCALSHTHTLCSNVDEIVLSYIAEVLCGLGESVDDEFSFDVQQFSEMVSAYVPEFAAVEWYIRVD